MTMAEAVVSVEDDVEMRDVDELVVIRGIHRLKLSDGGAKRSPNSQSRSSSSSPPSDAKKEASHKRTRENSAVDMSRKALKL